MNELMEETLEKGCSFVIISKYIIREILEEIDEYIGESESQRT